MAGRVLVNQPLDPGEVEKTRPFQTTIPAHALKPWLEFPPEPRRERQGKALLRSVEELVGNVRLERFLQDRFPLEAFQLEAGRQARRPLDEMVVEERLPHLEAVRHARPVDL